jgi:DNA-binding NarL/FixJ family response regulator
MYCSDQDLVARLRESAPAGEAMASTDSWNSFQRSAAERESLVVVLPGEVTADQVDRLATLQRQHPHHPLVLAVDRDAENLRRLSRLRVAEMVWTEELDRHLWPTLRRARTGGALRRFARRFEGAEWIPARLRQALAAACRSSTPVYTVPQLAALVGRDRRTLWRLWQTTFGPRPPLRLQDFVDWLLLVRAAVLRATGLRWAAVADDLGVHEHTIARTARRLAGRNLRELAAGGPTEVTRRFEARVLTALLDRGDVRRSGNHA